MKRQHLLILGAIFSGVIGVGLMYRRNLSTYLALQYETSNAKNLAGASNKAFAFINVLVNGCSVRALVDSGTTGSMTISDDYKSCIPNQATGGIVNVKLQLPDGPEFDSSVKYDPNVPLTAIGMADLSRVYDVQFTSTGVNLTPKAGMQPAAPAAPAAAPADTTATPTTTQTCPTGQHMDTETNKCVDDDDKKKKKKKKKSSSGGGGGGGSNFPKVGSPQRPKTPKQTGPRFLGDTSHGNVAFIHNRVAMISII